MSMQKKYKDLVRLGRSIFTVAFMLLICLSTEKMNINAASSNPTMIVNTAEQLNNALGGNHEVKDNTLILMEDVILDHNIIISRDAYNNPITLDANGKTITEEGTDSVITVEKAKFIIKGNGTFKSDEHQVFSVGESAEIKVEDGTYQSGGSAAVFNGEYVYKKSTSKLILNGGTFLGKAITGDGSGTLHITVDGATVGKVCLYNPVYWNDDFVDGCKGSDWFTINLKSGSISEIVCKDTNIMISGGTVGSGGIDADEGISATYNLTVTGGTITGPVRCGKTVKIKGGTLSTLKCTGKLVMSGGTISSNKKYALSLNTSKVTNKITGGTIISKKKGGRGIEVLRSSKLTICGGNIKSANNNGSAGIYVYGEKRDQISGEAKVTFQAQKGTSLKVSGFKYGCYRMKGKTTLYELKKHSKISVPNVRKTAYYSGAKMPRILNGNLVMKYSVKK